MTLNEFITHLEAIRAEEGGDIEVWSETGKSDGYAKSMPLVEVSDLQYKSSPFLHLCSEWSARPELKIPGPKVIIV